MVCAAAYYLSLMCLCETFTVACYIKGDDVYIFLPNTFIPCIHTCKYINKKDLFTWDMLFSFIFLEGLEATKCR